jgi:hypothetical protein
VLFAQINYQIIAIGGVELMKKRIILVLLLLALMLGMAVSAEATVATKPITVDYADIMIFVNGNTISLQPDEEPFIYNGRTFVPIRFVSEALNQTVEWIDWIKAVKITGGADANALAEKDQEIAALKAQVTSLQNRIDYLEDDEEEVVDTDEELSDLEDELIDDYEYLENVEIDDIRLDGDEDDVDVEIDVDLDEYGDDWEDLDDGDIEDWLDDLVSDIQDEFSDDTVVTGDITDIDSDDVLVKFEKDGDDDLEVTFKDDDYRDSSGSSSSDDADDVIESLEDEDYDVGGIDFTMNITYYEDDDRVSANLRAVYNDAESDWDDLSDSEIESDVEDICQDIADAFEDDADISLELIKIYFYDRDDSLLDSFNYDVEDGEL